MKCCATYELRDAVKLAVSFIQFQYVPRHAEYHYSALMGSRTRRTADSPFLFVLASPRPHYVLLSELCRCLNFTILCSHKLGLSKITGRISCKNRTTRNYHRASFPLAGYCHQADAYCLNPFANGIDGVNERIAKFARSGIKVKCACGSIYEIRSV